MTTVKCVGSDSNGRYHSILAGSRQGKTVLIRGAKLLGMSPGEFLKQIAKPMSGAELLGIPPDEFLKLFAQPVKPHAQQNSVTNIREKRDDL